MTTTRTRLTSTPSAAGATLMLEVPVLCAAGSAPACSAPRRRGEATGLRAEAAEATR